ncbi:hydrogenase 4 subunit B [Desulforamulus ruminis]|uniref:NADH/Ubiquinone/plastoquinone (Complex I) n=1 Tax=Desulforamulus ruminis (strain ATCC 23193 / DSM 2154 / NCIMB 8452 / DL) TaxID=696281 RepID=F6DVK6_DESRL|nr:hydrogenase 4 subunit B [Desulforamulus ruminis]AEG61466.1 NADH/Ubiquinone/plastoquinone (complex I) [Desulforamulus ruminis DSM 2154]
MSQETLEIIFVLSFVVYFLGAVLPLILRYKRKLSLALGCFAGALASLLGFMVGIETLLSPLPLTIHLVNILPGVDFHLSIDRLSGFFLATLSLVTFLVSCFSWNYMKLYRQENLAWWCFCYNLFVLSMSLLVTVNNAITFLIAWELMTLASYFLVTFEYRHQPVRKAGFSYIVMTHLGTVFIIASFLMMSNGNGWDFSTLSKNSAAMPEMTRSMVFIFALIGFGTKAGIVPLHLWLPMAHPAAPSNISAVMSGIMLKTAIYGLIRLVFDLLGPGQAWWGGVILAVGIVSSLIGVLYALMEQDLKRLLAYSSVENIGIILMGIGTGFIFYSWSMMIPAAMAMAAGMFHLLNHAIFKSLLFLGAGSIYYATGSRDTEKLGGLIKKMPHTAILFLVGSLAISAIPPFNGFASEYQIYQSLLNLSYLKISGFWSIGAILACVALALTGALAAACFIKAFGLTFLALPRTAKAAEAQEVPWPMRLSMAPLAVLCLALGIFPGPVLNLLTGITSQLVGSPPIPQIATFNANLALVLLITLGLLWGITRLMGGAKVRRTETWGCGIDLDATMEYSSASFSQPLRRVYGTLLQPQRQISLRFKQLPYFGYHITFKEPVRSVIKDYLYSPLRKITLVLSKKWQCIQSGSIHLYLSYIFITLVILLLFNE